MAIFSIFPDGAAAILVSKMWEFRGGKGHDGQSASSVKPVLRYGHFSNFQNGGRRHLEL